MDNTDLSLRAGSYLKGKRTADSAGLTLVDLLRRAARENPQRTALVYNDFSLSYREFDRLTDLLAVELVRRGVVRGDRVGIGTYHDELAFISILGIAKAGAAYTPLNPQHPPQRLLNIIEDAGIRVLIAGEGLNLSGFQGTIINGREFLGSVDYKALDYKAVGSKGGGAPPSGLPDPVPEDCLMVEYTSGSTGNPKGVMISHRNALFFPACYKRLTGLSSQDAVASYASLSFIIHTFDFFAAIMSGAEVHIIGDNIRLDTKTVNEYFEKNNITVAFVPFSFGHRFIMQEDNHSLRFLYMAGEPFIPLPELTRSYKIFNTYGCTECSSVSTGEVKPGDQHVTVGTPVDNMDVYIIDENGTIVKRGEQGELCASGPSVAAGYLNRPEKTAEVFIDNPFSDEPDYRKLYKTGDLARITENGEIVITGRVDFQIKLRGYRIEPGEIDACIRRFPGVSESVTVAVENRAGVKQLVSYIAAHEQVNPEELKNFAADFLPPYMVPKFIEQLPKLPRNVNGKLDRAKLPPPHFQRKGYVPPEGKTEENLARLWATVLGLDKENISRDADFFRTGGDSLRATILSFEISNELALLLSPAEIVKTPVLKDQAVILTLSGGYKAVHVFSAAGGRVPLFFVHGGNIGPETLVGLAQNLPADQSFYCFENYNVHHPQNRIKGIEAVARRYIKTMRETVTSGPYALGGWSYGGLVAFEMACLFEQAGDRIEHLYLMDPNLINSPREKELHEKLIATDYFREYLTHDPLFERFRAMGLLDRLMENYREVSADMLAYRPAVSYRGKVTLFKALEPDPMSPDTSPEIVETQKKLWQIAYEKKDNGFGEYAAQLRIVTINDSHDMLGQGEAVRKIASVIGEG